MKIKALKDIRSPKGLVIVRQGQVAIAANDYAERWIASGLAEEYKPDRKPIDIPAVLKRRQRKKNTK